MLKKIYDQAKEALLENQYLLDKLAKELLDKEQLDRVDLKYVLHERY